MINQPANETRSKPLFTLVLAVSLEAKVVSFRKCIF